MAFRLGTFSIQQSSRALSIVTIAWGGGDWMNVSATDTGIYGFLRNAFMSKVQPCTHSFAETREKPMFLFRKTHRFWKG